MLGMIIKMEFCHLIGVRTIHQTRRPAQPGQPAHVRPASTRSDVFGGRMRVPMKLTRPLTSRFLFFGFQTRNTWPEPIVYPYQRSITIFRPDSARSSRYPTNLGQISTDLARFLSDLDESGHISARSRRIWLDFGQISLNPARFHPRW